MVYIGPTIGLLYIAIHVSLILSVFFEKIQIKLKQNIIIIVHDL